MYAAATQSANQVLELSVLTGANILLRQTIEVYEDTELTKPAEPKSRTD